MKSKKLLLSGISAILVFFISSIVELPVPIFSQTNERHVAKVYESTLTEDKKITSVLDTINTADNNKDIAESDKELFNETPILLNSAIISNSALLISNKFDAVTQSNNIESSKIDETENKYKNDILDKTITTDNNVTADNKITHEKPKSSVLSTTTDGTKVAKKEDSLYSGITYGRISDIDAENATIAISVADPYVNVRNSADPEAKILGKLYKGSAAAVLKTEGEWALIKSGTVKGYIKSEYLNMKLSNEEIIEKYGIVRAKVISDGLNVRAKKKIESDRLTVIYSDEVYNALDITDEWVKIKVDDDNVTGYVAKEFVELIVNYNQAISLEEEKALLRLKEKNAAKQTLAVQTNSRVSYSNDELKLLACLVNAESGNQPYEGRLAVANVVLNRVKSSLYPDSIKNVIYQSGQFSVVKSGSLGKQLSSYTNYNSDSQKLSIEAARSALEGNNNIGDCLYFSRYSSSLRNSHPNGVRIEAHLFW